jgi:hypothetical protein
VQYVDNSIIVNYIYTGVGESRVIWRMCYQLLL